MRARRRDAEWAAALRMSQPPFLFANHRTSRTLLAPKAFNHQVGRCSAFRRQGHMGITVSIPHQLDRTEARRRIEKGFAQIIHVLPGIAATCNERWEGDRLIFSVGAMGQTVSGVVTVLDHAVTMEIDLPGVLGLLAGRFKDRMQKAGQLLLKKD